MIIYKWTPEGYFNGMCHHSYLRNVVPVTFSNDKKRTLDFDDDSDEDNDDEIQAQPTKLQKI